MIANTFRRWVANLLRRDFLAVAGVMAFLVSGLTLVRLGRVAVPVSPDRSRSVTPADFKPRSVVVKHDFGNVLSGSTETLSHRFTVPAHADFDSAVSIVATPRSPCCTEFDARFLAESQTIECEIRAKLGGGKGRFVWKGDLRAVGVEPDRLECIVYATVYPQLEWRSSAPSIVIPDGEFRVLNSELILRDASQELRNLNIDCDAAGVSILQKAITTLRLDSEADAWNAWLITFPVRLTPLGDGHARIVVSIDDRSVGSIDLDWRVQPPLKVNPQAHVFRAIGDSVRVAVSRPDGRPVEILQLDCPPSFSATIDDNDSAALAFVTISYVGDEASEGQRLARVLVHAENGSTSFPVYVKPER